MAHKRVLEAELAVVTWQLSGLGPVPARLSRRVRVLKKRADRLFERGPWASPSYWDCGASPEPGGTLRIETWADPAAAASHAAH
jgi:hypothetical protein